MKENKTYIAADFERYYAGTMPPHEMHALEKAALEDQFLADALEGYINTSDFAGDILELKARLKEKEKKKNIFSISPFTQNRWWRIVALFIIIAGAGFFFYQLNFIDKQDSFARNELKPSETKKENITPIVKDSTTANNDVAFEEKTASQSSGKEKPDVLKSSARNEKDNAAPKLKKRSGAILLQQANQKILRLRIILL